MTGMVEALKEEIVELEKSCDEYVAAIAELEETIEFKDAKIQVLEERRDELESLAQKLKAFVESLAGVL